MYKTYLIFPDNYAWSLSAATSLHLGGTMGELMALCQTLQDASRVGPSGDLDAWEAGWSELAERVFKMAREEEEKECYVSARETYKRAAAYFHSAERMLPGKSKRRVELFVRHQEAFAKYAQYRRPPMEYVTFPFSNFASGSIPQTFSPTVAITPDVAAPIAKPSQFILATSVEPKAPVKIGSFKATPPILLSTFTFSNNATSESASIPLAPNTLVCILKSDQSKPKSFSAPAVLLPNWAGSG